MSGSLIGSTQLCKLSVNGPCPDFDPVVIVRSGVCGNKTSVFVFVLFFIHSSLL